MEHFQYPGILPGLPPFTSPSSSPRYPLSSVLPVFELYINIISQYVFIFDWLLSLNIFVRFMHIWLRPVCFYCIYYSIHTSYHGWIVGQIHFFAIQYMNILLLCFGATQAVIFPPFFSSLSCTQEIQYFKKLIFNTLGASEVSEEGVEDDDEDFDWEIEQSPYEEVPEGAVHPQGHYGFGGLRSGVFQRLQVRCLPRRPGHLGFTRRYCGLSSAHPGSEFVNVTGGDLLRAQSSAPVRTHDRCSCLSIARLLGPGSTHPGG